MIQQLTQEFSGGSRSPPLEGSGYRRKSKIRSTAILLPFILQKKSPIAFWEQEPAF